MAEFMAGLSAGVVGAALIHPIDSLRVISQKNLNLSYAQSLSQLYKTGLTAGIVPALATQALIYSLVFGVQEQIHASMVDGGERTMFTSALSGSITGVIITPITCPLEVMKCRQQAGKVKTPPSMLFRGLLATTMRCGLGNAAFFACIHYLGKSKQYGWYLIS